MLFRSRLAGSAPSASASAAAATAECQGVTHDPDIGGARGIVLGKCVSKGLGTGTSTNSSSIGTGPTSKVGGTPVVSTILYTEQVSTTGVNGSPTVANVVRTSRVTAVAAATGAGSTSGAERWARGRESVGAVLWAIILSLAMA